MLAMVVFFIAFRWIHLSTPLIRLFLLVLILLLMPTLNFLPVWFALSLLRFRLPSRLPTWRCAGWWYSSLEAGDDFSAAYRRLRHTSIADRVEGAEVGETL